MPRSLTANQIEHKNYISEIEPWILLVEIVISHIRTLDYDGQTQNFTVGALVVGQTSGAVARIIADSDSGSAGTLTLYDVRGEFEDDETIKDNVPVSGSYGEAVVDGTLTDPGDTTYRYAAALENITWDGETWIRRAMEPDTVEYSGEGKLHSMNISIEALDFSDAFTDYIYRCRGLKAGEAVTIRYVHEAHLADAAAIEEEYVIAETAVGDGEFIELSLVVPERVFGLFPKDVYDQVYCRYKFVDGDTCQYGGSDTTCGRLLANCLEKDNVINFGGFPGIPGQEFE